MNDPRLDRQVHFDERSRSFAASADRLRSYTWHLGADTLDQGREGHCVGFCISHEATAKPAIVPQTNISAHDAFFVAQRIDRTAHGLNFQSGATMLAGMKAGVELGWWTGYEWTFGVDHLARSVGVNGPHCLGVNWYQQMYQPDDKGFIRPGGSLAGGHAIVCLGIDARDGTFLLANSWGPGWSRIDWRRKSLPGHCKVTYEDMDRLLREDGEAAVPTGRRR